MRGALDRVGDPRVGLRIIPAYAGSTVALVALFMVCGDHPRVCGEHNTRKRTKYKSVGSSPRMRGAPAEQVGVRAGPGIIPAYAESTPQIAEAGRERRDHPRVCGEHLTHTIQCVPVCGSSPRMRGAPGCSSSLLDDMRIIPAYAGSTGGPADESGKGEDHPRVCGEHPSTMTASLGAWGSSPRMRGAPGTLGAGGPGRRIIPAYAGSTHGPCPS